MSTAPIRPDRGTELRVFGVNACLAVFARRAHAIRKAYLLESRVPQFRAMLADLAKRKVGYRLVAAEDLEKLSQSEHHEGVCLDVLRAPPAPLRTWLSARGRETRGKTSLLILLDGVANPHNFGAVLRIAAHFGADAVLLPPGSKLALSGAACRVAEGGAEAVALLALSDYVADLAALERSGYRLIATAVRGGADLYAGQLPRQAVLMFGAETGGMSDLLLRRAQELLRIPGTGAVESLNIASAVAVFAAEHWRRNR
jgi:TrmH RNA methyltransferase